LLDALHLKFHVSVLEAPVPHLLLYLRDNLDQILKVELHELLLTLRLKSAIKAISVELVNPPVVVKIKYAVHNL
jgi:hypothetical protein